jgi:hypothetical protein
MSNRKSTDGEYTTTVHVHHSVYKLRVPLLNTKMNKEIKDGIRMSNKKIYHSMIWKAIKQVLNTITVTTNR